MKRRSFLGGILALPAATSKVAAGVAENVATTVARQFEMSAAVSYWDSLVCDPIYPTVNDFTGKVEGGDRAIEKVADGGWSCREDLDMHYDPMLNADVEIYPMEVW